MELRPEVVGRVTGAGEAEWVQKGGSGRTMPKGKIRKRRVNGVMAAACHS